MKIKQITENTTSGSIATVDTALGGTRSRGNPSIYGGKKVGSLFKGKKTKAQYANSVNESAELSEAQLEEEDIIVVPGQGRSRKNGFVPHGKSRVDHEVEMARSDLFSAAKNAQQVYSMIKDVSEDEGLDGWVQEKIIKANDYLNTIREYLEGKQVQGVAEGYDPVESDYQQWEDILVKDGYRGDPSGAYALKLVVGHQLMLDPAEVASTIRNILTYVKQNRQVLGKAVSDRTTVKDAIIDIKNKFPQQYQAAQQPQGVAEGADEGIRPQGKILKRLRDIAIMSPTLTFQNFRQSGKEAIITDAIMACKIMKHYFLQNKNQPTAQIIYNLENELDDFRRGRKLDTPDGNEYTMDLSDLSRRTLGKIQFQTKEGVAEGKRNLKCVCKTHGQDQCPVHAPIDEGSNSSNKNKKA